MKKKRTNPYKEAYIKGPLNLTDDDIRTLRQRYLEVK